VSGTEIKNINIYYADDDLDDTFLFQKALKEIGVNCELSTYTSGIELMSHLQNTFIYPSIIFLDINMPLKNGLECLTEMKQLQGLNNIAVIIISTSSSDVFKEKALSLGASDYIQKPSSFAELKEKIRTVITSAVLDMAV